jgi:hypothetical protein
MTRELLRHVDLTSYLPVFGINIGGGRLEPGSGGLAYLYSARVAIAACPPRNLHKPI